jgi:membrane protein DedA with SNARE-associated domain
MSIDASLFFNSDRLFEFMASVSSGQLVLMTAIFMFLNSSVMTPPSQYICMTAGLVATANGTPLHLVILTAAMANFLGTAIWFVLGKRGLYLAITQTPIFSFPLLSPYVRYLPAIRDLLNQNKFLALSLWRLVPVVRSIVSLPAGDLNISWWSFSIGSLFGILISCSIWTIIGSTLGQLRPAIASIIGVLIGASAIIIFWIARKRYLYSEV